MLTTWPADFPGFSAAAKRLAQRITALSGGTLAVEVLPSGSLVPPFGEFNAVGDGKAEMYHAIESYWHDRSPGFDFSGALPFGLTPQEMTAWIFQGEGQTLWDALAAGFNIKPFMAGNTGIQKGGWFKREIKTVNDLRGLRIAVSGLGSQVYRRLGAAPVVLPGREIPEALGSGRIEAAEWFGPWHGQTVSLPQVAPYYSYPSVFEPGTTLSLGVNLDFWNSLSDTQKQVIVVAATAETTVTLAEFEARNADAMAEIERQKAIEPRKLPNDVLMALGEAAGDVVAEAGAFDDMTRWIYQAYIAFRGKSVAWSKLSRHAYLQARLLPFAYDRQSTL